MLRLVKDLFSLCVKFVRDAAERILLHFDKPRPKAEEPPSAAPPVEKVKKFRKKLEKKSGERRKVRRGSSFGFGHQPLFYPAEPLEPPPLCVPLPAGWHDDPYYTPRAYAYSGCSPTAGLPPQYGVFATTLRAGEMLAQNYNEPFAHAYFGPPDSGKTYLEGVHIESALQENRYQNVLPAPQCGIALSYGHHGGGGRAIEQLAARRPNQDPKEVLRLIRHHGTLPQGLEDVLALTLHKKTRELHEKHPHCAVASLKFPCHALGISGIKGLMVMREKEDSLLSEEVTDLLNTLPRGFKKADFIHAVKTYPFRNQYMRELVLRRARLACKFIDDRADLRGLLKPGRLIVVEICDSMLPVKKAMKLFQMLLNVLVLGEEAAPCGLLLCIHEAHHFLEHKEMRQQIERIIKERRHLRTSVVLSSQDPCQVPHSTLAELDGVGLFGTASDKAIRHLGGDIEPFRHLSAGECARLLPGQMYFWSRRWFQPYLPGEFDGGLVRAEVRPRLSHHGGATRTAIDRGAQGVRAAA